MTHAERENERGAIVLGWILKLIVSIAIVGAVAFEAGAIVVAHVSSDSAATEVSGEAVSVLRQGGDAKQIEAAARAEAERRNVTLIAVEVAGGREAVTVTVEKKAKTMLLHRIPWTESWTVAQTSKRRPAGQ